MIDDKQKNDSLFSRSNDWSVRKEERVEVEDERPKRRERAAMYEFTPEYLYRRAYSEVKLLDLFGTFDFKEGHCYNFLTAGDIDGMSYLKALLRSQRLSHCILSTWCMSAGDAFQIITWLEDGSIGNMDLYVGEIFKGSYGAVWHQLHDWYAANPGRGRIAIFRNHSKVIAGVGDRFAFGLQTSANFDTNPRTEQASLSIDRGLYDFYKDYFDKIITFEKEDR